MQFLTSVPNFWGPADPLQIRNICYRGGVKCLHCFVQGILERTGEGKSTRRFQEIARETADGGRP